MRRASMSLAALLLTACGGGSSSFDPVTRVSLVEVVPGAQGGWSRWDSRGSSVDVRASLDAQWRLRVLVHECWHLLTRDGSHPNQCSCVSAEALCPWSQGEIEGGPPVLCDDEVAQAVASGRTVTLSFPEDPACAQACADVWNEAVGHEVVAVER